MVNLLYGNKMGGAVRNAAKTVLLVVGVFFCCSVLGCGGGGGGGGGGASASGGTNSQLESEVFRELNLARTEPATYAGFLREYKSHIINQGGTDYYAPPGKTKIRLNEGTAAVDEAIAVLESKTPAGALTLSKGMSLGARDHVLDTGSKGLTGHDGTDGSSGGDRINRYGTWHSGRGENFSTAIKMPVVLSCSLLSMTVFLAGDTERIFTILLIPLWESRVGLIPYTAVCACKILQMPIPRKTKTPRRFEH